MTKPKKSKHKKSIPKQSTQRRSESSSGNGKIVFYPLPPNASGFMRRIWSLVGLVSALAAILIPAYLVFINQSFLYEAVKRIPTFVQAVVFGGLAILMISRWVFIFYRQINFRKYISNQNFGWRVRRFDILISSMGATFFMVIIVYGIGLVDSLARYFTLVFPNLGNKISYTISTILGWIVSGVIGNAAYDFIRKLFRRSSYNEV